MQKWVSTAGPRQTKATESALSQLRWEGTATTELMGIIGGEERSYTTNEVFGACRPEVTAIHDAIHTRFHGVITRENYAAIIDAAGVGLIEAHKSRPVRDLRRTKEQDETNRREMAEADAKREEERKATEKARAEAAAKYKAEHPYLVTAAETGKGYQVLGAINIRMELARAFPGIAFRVKSESYSGGNSIDVEWTDGPTRQEVDAVVDKYEYGTFDPMTDCAGIDSNSHAFAQVFGGARHVMTHRHVGGDTGTILHAAMIALADTNGETGDYVRQLWDTTSLKAGQKVTGVRFAADNEEGDAKGYRGMVAVLSEPPVVPVVPAASQTWMDGTTHVTARYNHTHGGVEISFQVKPDATVIARLKSYGFRWSMRSRCWWHKITPQAEALAVEMAGEIRGGKPTAGEIRPDPMGVDEAYEDACAAACGL